jgi:hypothetical protein
MCTNGPQTATVWRYSTRSQFSSPVAYETPSTMQTNVWHVNPRSRNEKTVEALCEETVQNKRAKLGAV